MDYLLKASGLVVILFLFYYFFLKNETFFRSIRSYFLIGLIIVIAIPLVEIPIYIEQTTNNISSFNFAELQLNQTTIVESFNWIQFLTFIYVFGVIVFCLKFLIQLISLGSLLSKHQFIKQDKYYYVETSKNISPFSFFNIIIYNKNQFSIDELEQIINHEKAHVLQWHSVDSILAHLLVVTLWFNPFVWLYRKAVQQNLEFLADAYALEMAQNSKLYKLTLLKTYSNNYCTEITNNFYNSLIKKRIIMLQKNRSKNKSQWKYALILPLLIGFIFTFNTKTIAQEKKLTDIENVDKLELKFQFNKDSKDENLTKQATFFKKQFNADIKFKGIKRNNKNEITAIKIISKYKSNSTVFVRKSDEPISPIIITYNSEIDKINIGDAVEEVEENIHFTHKKNIEKLKRNNNVWISKKDNDTIIVTDSKVIFPKEDNYHVKIDSAIFILDNGEQTEINVDEINASENVFVVKSNEKGKKDKIIITNSEISFPSDKEQPLYILNEKEITAEEMKVLDPNKIQSVNVFKDKSALNKYGEKGKNGVIEITTKKKYSISINVDENDIYSNLTRIVNDDKPMILVNGKEVSAEEMKKIDIETIKSMNVIKDENATKKYGEKGKNGVIEITLKNNN